MYISCTVTIVQARLSLGSDGHVLVGRYSYRYTSWSCKHTDFEYCPPDLAEEPQPMRSVQGLLGRPVLPCK